MPKAPVLYEAMYILSTSISDEEIAGLEDRLKAGIEGQGAQFESVHEFGRRRLAYQILGHTEGIYRVMYFRGTGAAVDELKHEFSLSEEIVRGMVVVANPKFMVAEKPAPAKPQDEAAGEAETAAEAAGEAETPAEDAEETETPAEVGEQDETSAEAGEEGAAEQGAEAEAEAEAGQEEAPEEPATEE